MTKENNNFLLNLQTLLHNIESRKLTQQSTEDYQELETLAKELNSNQLNSFLLTDEENFKEVLYVKYKTNSGRKKVLSGFKTKAFLIHYLFNLIFSLGSKYVVHKNMLNSSELATSQYKNFKIVIKNYRQIKIPELRFLFMQLMRTQFIPLIKIDFNSTADDYDSKYIGISLYLCR